MRVAYLGPPGTFTEDALRAAESRRGEAVEAIPASSVFAAIDAVSGGEADRAFVPYENSIEGSVRPTLDALAFDAPDVAIVGEVDFAIRHCLIAGRELELEEVTAVLSHPQGIAQCARFLRERVPGAEIISAASTADAVREVCEGTEPRAALGSRAASELYAGSVLAEDVQDEEENVTRFVWIGPAGAPVEGEGVWRTSLVFAELGDDHPGALVEALQSFSERGVNLTRIESRPLRRGLGRYMFFIDLEGRLTDEPVAEAVAQLRSHAESVRILGTYPAAAAAD